MSLAVCFFCCLLRVIQISYSPQFFVIVLLRERKAMESDTPLLIVDMLERDLLKLGRSVKITYRSPWRIDKEILCIPLKRKKEKKIACNYF